MDFVSDRKQRNRQKLQDKVIIRWSLIHICIQAWHFSTQKRWFCWNNGMRKFLGSNLRVILDVGSFCRIFDCKRIFRNKNLQTAIWCTNSKDRSTFERMSISMNALPLTSPSTHQKLKGSFFSSKFCCLSMVWQNLYLQMSRIWNLHQFH